MSRINMPDVGVMERELSPDRLLLWPNPGENQFHFHPNWPGTYELVDMQGRIVRTGILRLGRMSVATSELENGTYLVRALGSSGQRLQAKWMKQ